VTAFEDLKRGDIVRASDPLSKKGRPMLILGAPHLSNHATQLITILLSMKSYHEEALTLRDDDYEGDHSENEVMCFRGRSRPQQCCRC
jgi:hypothetical protein